MKTLGTGVKWLAAALVLVAIAGPLGCGGGGSAGSPGPPPPALTITTQTPLPGAVRGQAYSTTLQASGGAPPYTWGIAAGSSGLPAGLTLSTGGVISGTPTNVGIFQPAIVLRDSAGQSVTSTFTLRSVDPLTFQSPPLPDGNVAVRYSAQFFASGGMDPHKWSLAASSGPLPAGLTLDSEFGILGGRPTAPGTFSFIVQVTDSGTPAQTATQTLSLRINNNLVIAQDSLPVALVNQAYTATLQAAGGTPPYHWALLPGATLPPGLSLDGTTGVVSGTPTLAENTSLVLQLTDSAPQPAAVTGFVGIAIRPPLTLLTTSLPDFARGLGYNASVRLDGGIPPLNLQVSAGTLPDGLLITRSSASEFGFFTIMGEPTKTGLFAFTLMGLDASTPPNTVTRDFRVRISEPIAISGPTSAQLLEGQTYAATFLATGGFPPYTWAAQGVLPGFTFDPSTATLSGTAGGASSPSIAITVHDSSSPPLTTGTRFSLQVFGRLRITTSMWPAIATGSNVWLTPGFTGGLGPWTWSTTGGSLPPGLSLRANDGTISGTATATGAYPLTLKVTDSNQGSLAQTASRQLTLTVKDRAQLTRNDAIAQATSISNGSLVASISPYSDPSTTGPDVDVYQAAAAPGALVEVYVAANIDAIQPPNPNSLLPVIEVVDGNGKRYQTCSSQLNSFGGPFNLPCVNGLDGTFSFRAAYVFQVPGGGATPVTFYLRVLDARGDARPDFLYTLGVFGVN